MQTICAISTPPGVGGLGVIRVSGQDAVSICEKIVRVRGGLQDLAAGGAAFASVWDGAEKVDEIVVTVFRAPRSFTGEDTVELSCHGGRYVLRRVMELLLANGCALAGAGEFTKRAFLNGKMDLTQAEAVIDLIHADSRLQAKSALGQMDGGLRRRVEAVQDALSGVTTEIMAYVDYPEETIGEIDERDILKKLTAAGEELSALCDTFRTGEIIGRGVRCAIVGRPNVGKSTLMNALCHAERSIVTEIPGTTRDLIEQSAVIRDIVLRLTDTAGIRETEDAVEKIGVERAEQAARAAELILLVLDGTKPLTAEDHALLRAYRDRAIVLLNKCDKAILADAPGALAVSAKTGEGLEALYDAIEKKVFDGLPEREDIIVTNLRQQEAIRRARDLTADSVAAIGAGHTPDLVGLDVEAAAAALGEVTGREIREKVIDDIFGRFCVGK